MQGMKLVQRLNQHRQWANERVLSTATDLTAEQLRQPFPIGQGSVWRSLLHLYAAEYVWLETLLGDDNALTPGDVRGQLPGNQLAGGIQTLDELIQHWQELAERWRVYLASLTDEQLDEVVYRISTSSGIGQRYGSRRSDVILHVCTHAQYTLAQVNNMFRQLHASTTDVMLITLARNESTPRS
ncbi:DinB family protein [Planctomicrobium piriforme]|uniref:Uncharacterized damage-inducible protein DinB (Forms a four-helix bundle) n=1 Tax=Planctomicrobium piriforme TaxID=1576369 RepID=A0A1I3QHP3_9PLAN|nr:DinB family protein [Planctomicrobium piriforme]SFJ33052.1 Uncharacterized damage-inducible protein DinB (forms a four-helix bundle) [Planctomicrobium piriforme]